MKEFCICGEEHDRPGGKYCTGCVGNFPVLSFLTWLRKTKVSETKLKNESQNSKLK